MAKHSSRVDYMVDTTRGMVRTIQSQTGGDLVFAASLYRHGRKLNSIDLADATAFSRLIRQYVRSEQPDKVRVELKTQGDGVVRWVKQFELMERGGDEVVRPPAAANYAGLGEAEVNEMVMRRFQELERQKELERANQELSDLRERNQELERELEDMSSTVEAKKQVEYYSAIIGAALPGLARFFQATAIGPALSFLAGSTEQEKDSEPDQETSSTAEMVCDFIRSMTEQEVATLYLLMTEVEKDRTVIQKVLHYITQGEKTQQR